ncbi:hypothetical protein PFICI_02108 [Pestalotiopsis fici W106-1]|uniref:non-specific serine/threonine protein kinase n=1 Tax=Pestalotiopsis fici (strain W106-1 / CGMCC3.15140) TaxID=1229662 RepID=W3XQP9_PESFW|nr:uncharacterized protein PFICI_02108 [Pestalotiopsis fici W106-1]ETS88280.1 hypothetical protein PFICI_02108 [Pestalotiopsis fici W106-1]
MLRRPPAEGRLVAEPRKAKVFLVLAVILLSWLSIAEAQQQQQSPKHEQLPVIADTLRDGGKSTEYHQRHDENEREKQRLMGDPANAHLAYESHDSSRLASSNFQESPLRAVSPGLVDGKHAVTTSYSSKNTNRQARSLDRQFPDPHDASALATVAPDYPVRAAKSPRQPSSILTGAGLSSPQSARSLERWEVEDYVLLATVDGHLRAVSKESGEERWHLVAEEPAVETIHHRPNDSFPGEHDRLPHDDYVWAIEPSHTGPVYVWMSSAHGSGLMSAGFSMKQLVDEFSPYAVQDPPVVYTGDKKTTMYILNAAKGQVLRWYGQGEGQVAPVATCFQPTGIVDADMEECAGTIALSRTEYTANIHHQDDGRLIATLRYREWGPNAYDNDLHRQYSSTRDNRYLTSRHDGRLYALDDSADMQSISVSFPAPVARVFDVARPQDVPRGGNPELVLLPQPPPPISEGDSARARGSSIYLNKTETGSWFALSGTLYPLVVDAPRAKASSKNGMDFDDENIIPDDVLIGTHSLGGLRGAEWAQGKSQWPSLPALPESEAEQPILLDNASVVPIRNDKSDAASMIKSVPKYVANSVVQLIKNPILYLIVASVVATWYKTRSTISLREHSYDKPDVAEIQSVEKLRIESDESPAEPTLPPPVLPATETSTDEVLNTNVLEVIPEADKATSTDVQEPGQAQDSTAAEAQIAVQRTTESPEKKKAHRGRRGGVKHKKKIHRDASVNQDTKRVTLDPVAQIDQMVEAQEPQLNPNIKSIGKADDIGVGGFEINGLKVDLDEQLGMGSNGTVVFPGTFHGREIAVKRMLHEFNDLATRETKLLLESDNHPNVIQYYAIHRDKTFLYIALERCQASLADIIDKPHVFKELAHAGERDIPNVLLQIANGVSHLHGLRIVHRDLKPQNILVTVTKDGRPRLVVSDFGLCKKLDGAQSSFGHTATRPAGTSGWRAPELLAEEDARENPNSMASMHSDSSTLVGAENAPNRRATRAIDIFSLGLVFFYVLTKGSHPFDCGDRYMREVNIRKGHINLQALEVLGDFAFEAEDLIRAMLSTDPRARPNTRSVMAHPFFWDSKKRLAFLCDVSDHFEKEQRDPPSDALIRLEQFAPRVCRGDFLKVLPKDFVESLGKQRKYTGTRLLDLLRALRNKWNHREDLSDALKKSVGTSHEDYLGYWTRRFPNLLVICCEVIWSLDLRDAVRFREYFEPMKP